MLVPPSLLGTAGVYAVTVQNPDPTYGGSSNYPSSVNFTLAGSCTYTLSTFLPTPPATYKSDGTGLGGEQISVIASAPSSAYTSVSNVPWISVLDNMSATGTATVDVAVAANTGASRTGNPRHCWTDCDADPRRRFDLFSDDDTDHGAVHNCRRPWQRDDHGGRKLRIVLRGFVRTVDLDRRKFRTVRGAGHNRLHGESQHRPGAHRHHSRGKRDNHDHASGAELLLRAEPCKCSGGRGRRDGVIDGDAHARELLMDRYTE